MKSILQFFLVILCLPGLAWSFSMNKDGLCFTNGTPELRRFGPMGELGSKKGICQGMSGIVSAFHEHASFQPTKTKMTYNEAMDAISELRRYHSGGCKLKKKVQITGYSNLFDFCKAHKNLLMANAIDYNTDIAVREISWNLEEFLILQDAPIKTNLGRLNLHAKVESLREDLKQGRWPLLLYYSHVVAVHSVTKTSDKVVFEIYDSNYSTSIEYTVAYSSDGLPKSGQKMIWNTTPNRLTTACW
jgi:hypothetical protein